MVKKKKSSKRLRVLGFLNRHWLLSVISVVLIILISFLGISYIREQVAISRERTQFMQAKADLHTLYEQIVAEVGQPTEHTSSQTCEYASSEFTKGPLSCSVGESFRMVSSDRQALDLATNTSKFIADRDIVKHFETRLPSMLDDSQSLRFDKFSLRDFPTCSAHYSNGRTELLVDLSCYKSAKTEYFRVVTNS